MEKKDWARGRPGICDEGPSERWSFQICPRVKKALNDYCSEKEDIKSLIINQAILEHIERNKK